MSPLSRAQAVKLAAERLTQAGVEDAADDARRLLQAASTLSAARLLTEMAAEMPAKEASVFESFIARREQREPLSHIFGSQPFWTLDLKVSRDVLTPRSDTETLVAEAIKGFGTQDAITVLDIATGSGAILLAVLSELPAATGIGTDLSETALGVAAENVALCQLSDRAQLIQTRWADGISGSFDLVLSNPPYIASAVVDGLDPEVVAYEPRLALDGGEDGLDPYPHLFEEAKRLLKPGGRSLFEIGYDQGPAVMDLARQAGARNPELVQDLAGRDRVVMASFA